MKIIRKILQKRIYFNVSKFKKPLLLFVSIFYFLANVNIYNLVALAGYEPEKKVYNHYLSDETDISKLPIVFEAKDKRTKYEKHFRKIDGSHEVAIYDEAIHYFDGVKYQDIDNSLIMDSNKNEYKNKANSFKINLPKNLKENKFITIKKDNYKLSWNILDINDSNIEVINNDIRSDDMTVLKNINQKVLYNDIFESVDLEYVIKGEKVKENFILNQYIKDFSLNMEIKANNLILDKDINGNILFINDNNEVIFSFDSYYMIDSNGNTSQDILIDIIELEKGKYKLTIKPDDNWLNSNDRAYPVTIDPIINIKNESSTGPIEDKYIYLGTSTSYYDQDYLYIGKSYNYPAARTLVNFDLSNIIDKQVITYASFDIAPNSSSSMCDNCQINLFNVPKYSLYDQYNGTYLPEIEDRVYDYIKPQSSDTVSMYSFNITKLVQNWKNNNQSEGLIILQNENESELKRSTIKSSENSDIEKRPTLRIGYVEASGLSDYWTYHNQVVGQAGMGYINDFTGNLTFVHNDYSGNHERMPFNISHIHNANLKDINIGYGNGWRTNFNERLYFDYEGLQDENYYIVDGDGKSTYYQDTLGLTCDTVEPNHCKVSEDGSGKVLAIGVRTMFGTIDYQLTDPYSNTVKIYDKSGRLIVIQDETTNDEIIIRYKDTQSDLIDTITDVVGNKAIFNYNANNLLENISIMKVAYDDAGNKLPDLKLFGKIVYDYGNSNNLGFITHYYGEQNTTENTNRYIYDSQERLYIVKDSFNPGIEYQYNSSDQVKRYQVEINDYTKEAYVDITYGLKETTYTDFRGKQEKYTFDNYGHTINILDSYGNAQFYQYEDIFENYTVDSVHPNYYMNHRLKYKSLPQKNVYNPILNHDFELKDAYGNWLAYWNKNISTGSGSASIGNTKLLYGSKSLQLTRNCLCSENNVEVYQTIKLNSGTYTISGYIQNNITNGNGAYITVSGANIITPSEKILNSADYKYVKVEFEVLSDNTDVTIKLRNESVSTSYFDHIQLTNGFIDSRYNLVENSSFEIGKQWPWDSIGTVVNLDEDIIYSNILGEKAIKLDKDHGLFSQYIPISGKQGDTIVFGGWAKAQAVPFKKEENRDFLIRLMFDGSDTNIYSFSFNPQTDDWQYLMRSIKTTGDYIGVFVEIVYQNENEALFDNIQIYKEEFGTEYQYYEDNGDLKIINEPFQDGETKFFYNNDHQVTRVIDPNSKEINMDYDSYKKPNWLLTPNSKTSFKYNMDGNVEEIIVGEKSFDENGDATGSWFSTKTSYTKTNQYVSSTTDEFGNSVNFDFDEVTGLLKSITDPEDITTNYQYDDLGRLKETDKGTSNNVYEYKDGRLDKITVNGFSYQFKYNEFGNVTEILVGDQQLMKYEYDEINGKYTGNLAEQTYGNGDSFKFDYDDEQRLSKIFFKKQEDLFYSDTPKFEYEYDDFNRLAKLIDNVNNKMYYYSYNQSGKLSRVTDESGNYVNYSFNNLGDLSGMGYNIDGIDHDVNYNYNDTNGLYDNTTYEANGTTVTKDYNYSRYTSGLTRLSSISINTGYANILTSYTYWDNLVTSGTKTYAIQSIVLDYKTIYYSYDKRGNIKSIEEVGKAGTPYETYYTHTDYQYDELNQLIRYDKFEENSETNTYLDTIVYDYDNNGNIKTISKYQDESSTPYEVISLSYRTTGWKDQLTAVYKNGFLLFSIDSYDNSGNPLEYNQWSLTWDGRQLTNLYYSQNGNEISYKYNDNGYRTQKIVNGVVTNYYLNGNKVLYEKTGDNTIYYTYDINGTIISFNYNGTEYWYIRNLQGDIIGIVDKNNNLLVEYSYDPYGNCKIKDNSGINLGEINPYRYRGYRFDEETNLYYLNSRYYDANIGRFINADGLIGQVGDILGHNIYAYCQNNPVMYVDPSGQISILNDAVKWISNAWDDTKDWVSGAYEDTKDWVSGAYDDTKDWVTGAYDDTKNWVSQAAKNTWNWTKQAGLDAWNWTKQAGIDAWNWTKQAGIDMWQWLNGDEWYQILTLRAIYSLVGAFATAGAICLLGLGTMAITPILIGAGIGLGLWYLYDLVFEEGEY